MTVDTAVATAPVIGETEVPAPAEDEAVLLEELLVEEISIDGMCGVY
jgi:mycofactocin precursor